MNIKVMLSTFAATLLISASVVQADCHGGHGDKDKSASADGEMQLAYGSSGGDDKAEAETEAATDSSDSEANAEPVDIVDTAVAAGSFTTLATALEAAGLVETLKGEGPFTVFAPTDEAFAEIPEETLNSVLEDKELLTTILTYHVVPGKVMAADVAGLETADTVAEIPLSIDTSDGVKINDATVVQADVAASNGVIHVIDTVLMPPSDTE